MWNPDRNGSKQWASAPNCRSFRNRILTTGLLVPNQRSENPKCFIWCRFGTENRHYSPLNCPYVVGKSLTHSI
jgi:hypothetical protein